MRWVKAHGADYYDWRTIPDVLEPGQELYGVYEFKRGFGGAVRRVIPTQDLVVRPALYWPYYTAVSLRRSMQRRKRAAFGGAANRRDGPRQKNSRAGRPTKRPDQPRRRRRQRRRELYGGLQAASGCGGGALAQVRAGRTSWPSVARSFRRG